MRAGQQVVADDPMLDEALARIYELTSRLRAVQELHRTRRSLLGGRVCEGCGWPAPCPTVQASRAS